jgi:NitT/TauT family transport system permease protein
MTLGVPDAPPVAAVRTSALDHGPLLIRAASAASFLLLWWMVAAWAADRALPDPPAVLRVAAAAVADGSLPQALGVTLARVLAAFLLAMVAGSAVGILMGRSRLADAAGDFWLVLLLNLPALVVILLAYIWFGQTEAATVAAVALIKLPAVAVTLREGARALDRGLDEMAQAYRFGLLARWRDVMLPQLQPYLAAAARAGLATAWKIVLVAELLGRPSGVGFEMNLRFQVFDVAGLLAYALAFAAVMLAIEAGVMRPAERRARAWRGLA